MSVRTPDAHEKTTLLYGWYPNRTHSYRNQQELLGDADPAEPASDVGNRASLEVRQSWARLIRQVYEINPLLRRHCGGTMKVIAVIERPAVARRILDHPGLPHHSAQSPMPPDQPDGLAANQPRDWSYEPLF